MHDATKPPSNPEEEFQISQDKGAIIEAIDALFALADDSNVCLKCGESGHPNYECPTKGGDQVKSALINLRKKLQGDDVDDKETSKRMTVRNKNVSVKRTTRPPGKESTCTSKISKLFRCR